jgi:hypothetical protein
MFIDAARRLTKTMSDGAPVRPQHSRQRLTDDDFPIRGGLPVERAPGEQGHAHRAEKVRRDDGRRNRRRRSAGRCGMLVRFECREKTTRVRRRRVGDRHRLHARQPLGLDAQQIAERGPLFGLAESRRARVESDGIEAVCVEAKTGALEIVDRVDQKQRADEQYRRKRDFADDERRTKTGATRRR